MDENSFAFNNEVQRSVDATLAASSKGRSLGRLRAPVAWLAGCQSRTVPTPLSDVHVIAVPRPRSGDAGNEQQTSAGSTGNTPLCMATEAAGARLTVLDNLAPVSERCIGREDALSPTEFDDAWEKGANSVDGLIDAGADAVVPTSLYSASTTVAAAVIGAFTRTEPVAISGPGTDATVDDAAWKTKVSLIRDAMFRARSHDVRSKPAELLRTIGSADLVALSSVIYQSARRRTPILVDGFVTATAALMAAKMDADDSVRPWIFCTGRSAEPGHHIALRLLEKEPLFELHLGPAVDTGALLALPILNTAVKEAAAILDNGTAG